MALFLWATLYLSVKHWRHGPGEIAQDKQIAPSLPDVEECAPERPAYPARFVARVGSRIQIVNPDQVLWVAAARDYAELHTQTSVHLLRETLTSLEKQLDPDRFLRIHRSRIIRVDQIVELVAMDNSEYRVKLRDGSEHRSSRTYAASLANWMRSGVNKDG
ncbi:MAG TPA: LytTR family DNA-binding domain-containing protein [Acidobacteriaceae bacterium]|nr:LytTR family DNA-binding domain-containing protein [Acidobacteriaceae bacterium]